MFLEYSENMSVAPDRPSILNHLSIFYHLLLCVQLFSQIAVYFSEGVENTRQENGIQNEICLR